MKPNFWDFDPTFLLQKKFVENQAILPWPKSITAKAKFFLLWPKLSDATDHPPDQNRTTVVKSCLLWPKCRMAWPKSRADFWARAPLVAVIVGCRPFQIFEIMASDNYCHKRSSSPTRATWFRPNHPTFRPQESWFDHCHPLAPDRPSANFGHKRKKFALAVIDFGQGKMAGFSQIFFYKRNFGSKSQKFGFIEENLKNWSTIPECPTIARYFFLTRFRA